MTTVSPAFSFRLPYVARKVPEVALWFWLVKLLTTAFGESTSDYLISLFNPYVVVVSAFVLFLGVISVQFMSRRYIPILYWATVSMVAVFGTMAADVVHVALGIPYIVSSIVFALVLTAVFVVWQRVEGSLSIHSITTRRRELFYWLAVVATFAMGTAVGDLLAYTLRLGFFASGVVCLVVFLMPGLLLWRQWLGSIVAFWAAYIMTRPLGASFADWTGKTTSVGGLGWGEGTVAIGLFLLILLFVGYLQVTHQDVDRSRESRPR